MSQDSLVAAHKLGRERHYRSSISRYYYAAFSAVVTRLSGRVKFPQGWDAPQHQVVPLLIEKHVLVRNTRSKRELKAAIRRLYASRIVADYRSGETVDERVLRSTRMDAERVCRQLLEGLQ